MIGYARFHSFVTRTMVLRSSSPEMTPCSMNLNSWSGVMSSARAKSCTAVGSASPNCCLSSSAKSWSFDKICVSALNPRWKRTASAPVTLSALPSASNAAWVFWPSKSVSRVAAFSSRKASDTSLIGMPSLFAELARRSK